MKLLSIIPCALWWLCRNRASVT